ncbi:MAG: hypothetical protein ACFFD4_09080 [Candidatus Odinarchaeota archaeon]
MLDKKSDRDCTENKERKNTGKEKQPSLRTLAEKMGLLDAVEARELLEKLERNTELLLWWLRGVQNLAGGEVTFKEKEILEIISRAIIELNIEETVPLMFKNPDRKILEKEFLLGDHLPPEIYT